MSLEKSAELDPVKRQQFQLEKWSKKDADSVAHFADNARIAQNLRNVFPHPYTKEDAQSFISSCIEGEGRGQLCRAIKIDGQAVGSISIFLGTDVYEKSAELGYWLAEEYWGQGIMTEAVKMICRQAFEAFDIVRIYAEPFAGNTGSLSLIHI